MFAFLAGPLGKLAGFGLVILIIAGVGWLYLHARDRAIAAEAQVAVANAQMADLQVQHDRQVDALQKVAKDATDQAAQLAKDKDSVARAPRTMACASSPAIAAALRSLHQLGSSATSPPSGAGVAPNVPASTGRAHANKG